MNRHSVAVHTAHDARRQGQPRGVCLKRPMRCTTTCACQTHEFRGISSSRSCARRCSWAARARRRPTSPTTPARSAALDQRRLGPARRPSAARSTPRRSPASTSASSTPTRQKLFYKLIGSLKSPCGKAHSLRTSFTSDTSCKRAPFAVRYVLAMLEDEVPEDEVARRVREEVRARPRQPVKLDVSKAPHAGADDAPIRLVEFFDYGCPHCAGVQADDGAGRSPTRRARSSPTS